MGGTLGPALFSLQQQMQPQGQPQQPQASPAPQAPPQTDPTQAAMQYLLKQAQGIPDTSQLTGQLGDIQNQMGSLPQVQAPQLWQPSLKPVTGAKSLFSDIGNALLLGTGIGRDIVGNVNKTRQQNFENQKQSQIEQLAQLKSQQEIPEKELGAKTGIAEAAGNLANRQGMLGVRQQMANIAQQRVNDTRDFRNQMVALDTSKLSEQERHNKQDETLRGMGVDVQRDRNNVILSLGDKRISVDATKFDASQNNKEQGFFDQIGVALGLKQFEGTGAGTTPLNTAAPAMQTNKPKPAKSTGKTATAQHVPGGQAGGLQEGATGTGSDGKKYVVRGGKWQAQ